MNITEFRQRYPQYQQTPDEDLSRALYEKHYADKVDYEAFASRFLAQPTSGFSPSIEGPKPEPAPQPTPEPLIQPGITEEAAQPTPTPVQPAPEPAEPGLVGEYPPPATLQQEWPPPAAQPLPPVAELVQQDDWPKRVVPHGTPTPSGPARTPSDIMRLGQEARKGIVGSLRTPSAAPPGGILEGIPPLPPVAGGEGLGGLPLDPMREAGPAVGPGIVAGAKRGAQVAGVQLGTMVPAGIQQYVGEDLAGNLFGPGGPMREVIEETTQLTPAEVAELPKPAGQDLPTKQEIERARQAKISARIEEDIAKIGPVAKGRAMAQKGRKRMMELAPPPGASTAEKWTQDFVAAGLGSFVPVLAVGAITRSPNLALGVMGMTVFPQSYVDYRERGRTHEQATVDALVVTAAETLTEKIPLEYILSPSGKRWLSRWLISAGLEGTQELVTSLLTSAYDAGVIGDKMTFGEAIKAALWEGSIGAGMGVGGAAATQPFQPKQPAKPGPEAGPPGAAPEAERAPLSAEVYFGEEEPATPATPPTPTPKGPTEGPATPATPPPQPPVEPPAAPPPVEPTPAPAETPEEAAAGRRAVDRQARAKETYRKRRMVDPDKDDLLTAIGKLGGISKTEAAAEFGLNADGPELKNRGGLFPAWKNKGGRSFDDMAEQLAEQRQYLSSDDPKRELHDKLTRAMAGEGVYAEGGAIRRAEQEAAEQEAWEREVAADDDFLPATYVDEDFEATPEDRTLADLGQRARDAGVPEGQVEAILERGAIQELTDAEIATELRAAAEEPRPGRPEAAQALEEREAAAAPEGVQRPPGRYKEPAPALELTAPAPPAQAPTKPAPTQRGLFAPPTTAEEVSAAARQKEAELRGEGLPQPEGPAALFDEGRRAQVDITDAAKQAEGDTATEAQRLAGNYRKGHVAIGGLDISIENEAGSKRRPEWPTLKHHYGYVKGTEARDGDHVDVFILREAVSEQVTARPAFVVDQSFPDSGRFDEHKVMLGFENLEQARKAYLANYTKGWKGLKDITETSFEDFKTWLDKGNTKRPFAGMQAEVAKAAKAKEKAAPEGKRLDLIPLPEETVTGPGGETYTIQRTAKAALEEVDARIQALNKLVECLHG